MVKDNEENDLLWDTSYSLVENVLKSLIIFMKQSFKKTQNETEIVEDKQLLVAFSSSQEWASANSYYICSTNF